ncbi:hypothetical protein AAMO2058_000167000 [Amorphochlora amoebiformis]
MTSPKFELTYFPIGGRALEIRLAFNIGKIDFKDNRLTFPEFGKAKAAGEFKYGVVPVLSVDGVQMGESLAILRYVGQLAKLYPEDPMEAFRVDEIVNVMENPSSAITFTLVPQRFGLEKFDEKEKMRIRGFINEKVLPPFIAGLEKTLAKNETKGFCVGSSLSIADLKVFGSIRNIKAGFLDGISDTLYDKAPCCLAVYKTVSEHPSVVAYFKANPKG